MSVAVIDVREWQKLFDLRTGKPTEASSPVVGLVGDVRKRRPYPGDTDTLSNAWVTETALDLIRGYDPQFVFLVYGHPYFSSRHSRMTAKERRTMIGATFREINRFVSQSGLISLIMGRGGMTPLKAFIDLSGLDGLAVSSHWSARYAGIYCPSPADLRRLAGHRHIKMIAGREDLLSLFNGTPADAARTPNSS